MQEEEEEEDADAVDAVPAEKAQKALKAAAAELKSQHRAKLGGGAAVAELERLADNLERSADEFGKEAKRAVIKALEGGGGGGGGGAGAGAGVGVGGGLAELSRLAEEAAALEGKLQDKKEEVLRQLKKDKEDLAGKLAAIKDACGEADLAVCAALKSGAKAAAKRAGELGEAQMVKFDAASDKIAVKYKKELMSLADIAKSL